MSQVTSSDMKGKEVIEPGGEVIGKVKDVYIDTNNWQVPSLDIALDGKIADAIGMKKRFGRADIPIKSSYIGRVGEKVLVNASREELTKYVTALRINDVTKEIQIPTSD
jgi:sporulation protein YlmC with PRC-barrel domain